MKWVLLLGLVVSLSQARTVFDYERDGLENKQEGDPGRSVQGQYEWRAPDGKVTEINYVADHLGFRLVEDPELKELSEPSSPSESTAPVSTKEVNDVVTGDGEEQEEEEGEEEEEEEEGEEEEQEVENEEENEVEGEDENSQGETKEQESQNAESDNAVADDSEKPKETEANTKSDEKDSPSDEKTGKNLNQNPDKTKEVVDKQESSDTTDSRTDSTDKTEKKITEEPKRSVQPPALVPVKVETTFAEETTAAEPSIIEVVPIIAAAEENHAVEPIVVPVSKLKVSAVPQDDVVVVGMTETEKVPPIAMATEIREVIADPATNPSVEIESVQIPIVSYPQAEPLQQPAVEVSPIEINDVEQAPPIAEILEFPAKSLPNSINVLPHNIQVFEVPQQVHQLAPEPLIQSTLPQIQVFEIRTSAALVERDLEMDPKVEATHSDVQVREAKEFDVDVNQKDFTPAMVLEIPQHRFQVAKAGRSMDSAPVQITKEHDPYMDLYFIPESFELSDPKPSQSSVHIVEVEAPIPKKEMIIKAKSFSKISDPENFLNKAKPMLEEPFVDSVDILPMDLSLPIEIQMPLINEDDFKREPEIISVPVQFVEVPAAALDHSEPGSHELTVELDTVAAPIAVMPTLAAPHPIAEENIAPGREIRLISVDEVDAPRSIEIEEDHKPIAIISPPEREFRLIPAEVVASQRSADIDKKPTPIAEMPSLPIPIAVVSPPEKEISLKPMQEVIFRGSVEIEDNPAPIAEMFSLPAPQPVVSPPEKEIRLNPVQEAAIPRSAEIDADFAPIAEVHLFPAPQPIASFPEEKIILIPVSEVESVADPDSTDDMPSLSVPGAIMSPPVREIRLTPTKEIPIQKSTEQPQEVILTEVPTSPSFSAEDTQAPTAFEEGPLLPPLLKITRLLKVPN